MPPEPTFLPCFPCTCATSPWVSLSPSLLYPSTPAVLPIPSLRHGRCRPSSLLLFWSSPSSIHPHHRFIPNGAVLVIVFHCPHRAIAATLVSFFPSWRPGRCHPSSLLLSQPCLVVPVVDSSSSVWSLSSVLSPAPGSHVSAVVVILSPTA